MLLLPLALAGCSEWVDADQVRRDPTVEAWLGPSDSVGQTFVARHAGLRGIEVGLEPEPGTQGEIQLELRPREGPRSLLRSARLSLSANAAPGFYRLTFDPIPDSHGKGYEAVLRFSGSGRVRVRAGPWDAYLDGALYVNGQPVEAQLIFRLVYEGRWILLDLFHAAGVGLILIGVALWLYGLPGWALLALGRGDQASAWGWADWVGRGVGVSLALYPVLFLWADVLGIRPGPLWIGVPAALGIAIILLGARWWRGKPWRSWRAAFGGPGGALIGVLALAVAVRLLAVRGLESPMWGDGFQHTVIVQLLLDHGGLFRSWEPYAPIESFTYHFGFHSAIALLAWAMGWPSDRAVLIGGQILNVLSALALYPLARRLAGGSAWAGVVAVTLPALLWPMPMFYVNWGRYPQLAGQVILPALVVQTWDVLESRRWNGGAIALLACMIAGLALTHYRVLAFYGAFIGAWALVRWLHLPGPTRRAQAFRLLAAGGLAAGLLIPWLLRLGEGRLPELLLQMMRTGSGESPIPLSWKDLLFYMPGWGWVLGAIALGVGMIRRPAEIGLLLAWWGGVYLIATPQLLRLPGSVVIGGFTFWIAFYLPMALLIGAALGERLLPWLWGGRYRWAGVALMGIAGLWGARDRLHEVQPGRYALLTRPDREAMAWIQHHLPEGARFLINGFLAYQGQDAVGSDGGWWLPLLARRAALIPPLPYAIERTRDPLLAARLREWIARLTAGDPQAVRELAGQGWCYVYIGQRQGRVNAPGPPLWIPEAMRGGPWEVRYHQDFVWIFKWQDCPEG